MTTTGTTENTGSDTTEGGVAAIASYADAIGPQKSLVIPIGENGQLDEPTELVDWAHRAGLLVHPWTFRAENAFLPGNLRRGDRLDRSDAGRTRARGGPASPAGLAPDAGDRRGLFGWHLAYLGRFIASWCAPSGQSPAQG